VDTEVGGYGIVTNFLKKKKSTKKSTAHIIMQHQTDYWVELIRNGESAVGDGVRWLRCDRG
jgi:hypothetical protein